VIILTGGAGFIGTNILIELNKRGEENILVVDNIEGTLKVKNLKGLKYREYVNKKYFWDWLLKNKSIKIDSIIHLGACSDTTQTNLNYLRQNNVVYSQKLWDLSVENDIPFIYASSAATYGNGSNGFSDEHSLIPKLQPLNPYGHSKQDFDLWILKQKKTPPLWVGLKYFNVYGPGEAHKGKMASVIWHFLLQLNRGENLKLFDASHGYAAGEQERDFIYVNDAVKMTLYMLNEISESGIYNIGTGRARTFNDLANTIKIKNRNIRVEYIPFPYRLMDAYQAHTCANLDKLFSLGYSEPILTIEKGVKQYLESCDLFRAY